jgi:predicted RNA-binding protein with PIN domain
MRWLIDGYNVIRRDPDLRAREAESLEAGRRALQHRLARAHRDPRDEFTVVFDGAGLPGGAPPGGRIRVIFSRPPMSADDELMRLARQWQSGAVVVSSDRKVQDAARRAGSAALTAEQFLAALEPASGVSAGSDRGLSAGSEPRRASIRPPSDQAGLEDPAPTDLATKDDADAPREKRGNPRRLSKKARKARRALGRLRQP